MTERIRSNDGTRDTEEFLKDMPETPSHQGRNGGEIARELGTRDALLRAETQGARGVTRLRKAAENKGGNRNGNGPGEVIAPDGEVEGPGQGPSGSDQPLDPAARSETMRSDNS